MDAGEALDALGARLADGLQRRRTGGHGRMLVVRSPESELDATVTVSDGHYRVWIDGDAEPVAPVADPDLAARRVAAIVAPAVTA